MKAKNDKIKHMQSTILKLESQIGGTRPVDDSFQRGGTTGLLTMTNQKKTFVEGSRASSAERDNQIKQVLMDSSKEVEERDQVIADQQATIE